MRIKCILSHISRLLVNTSIELFTNVISVKEFEFLAVLHFTTLFSVRKLSYIAIATFQHVYGLKNPCLSEIRGKQIGREPL